MIKTFSYFKRFKFLLFLIIPALFLYMLVIFPSGSYYCLEERCGLFFWGVHGRDAIWHLAIAETSFKQFPFIAPTYSGEKLYGYNWLLDFLIFVLSKVGISSLFSYFKLIPVLWFFVFTFLLIVFARKIKDNPAFVGIFLFLSYFAGSFSYLLTLYHSKTIKNSSQLLPQPVIHSMSNLEYALSLLVLILLLNKTFDKRINFKKIIIFGILIFLLLGLKFYGGAIGVFMVVLHVILASNDSGVVVSLLPRMTKKLIYLFIIFCFIFFGILLFYNPASVSKTGFPFAFSPFALVHPITEAPDQFYLRNMTDARYYLQQFGIGPRLIGIEMINLFIFLVFYFGTRFFGLLYITIHFIKSLTSFPRKWESKKTTGSLTKSGMTNERNNSDSFDLTVTLTIIFSILLTVTLVQKGVWWNTIQFFFYGIFLSTIYLAKMLFNFFNSKKKSLVYIGLLIILMSVPTSFDLINHFLKESKAVYLPKNEIEALAFLRKQPAGVIYSPLKEEPLNKEEPYPINKYYDSSYISAFTGKQLYLAEIQSLSVTSIDYQKRLEKVNKMDCSILNEINYVYEVKDLPKKNRILVKCKNKKANKIYENNSVTIFMVF